MVFQLHLLLFFRLQLCFGFNGLIDYLLYVKGRRFRQLQSLFGVWTLFEGAVFNRKYSPIVGSYQFGEICLCSASLMVIGEYGGCMWRIPGFSGFLVDLFGSKGEMAGFDQEQVIIVHALIILV